MMIFIILIMEYSTVSPSPSKCPMSLSLLCSEVLAGMVVAGKASWQCLHIHYTIPCNNRLSKEVYWMV